MDLEEREDGSKDWEEWRKGKLWSRCNVWENVLEKIYWQSDGGHSASVPVYLIQSQTAKGREEFPKCRPGQFFIFLVLRTTKFLWCWDSKMNIVIFSVKALNLRKVQARLTCSWDRSWTPNPKLWDHRKEPLCPAEIGFKCLSWKRGSNVAITQWHSRRKKWN